MKHIDVRGLVLLLVFLLSRSADADFIGSNAMTRVLALRNGAHQGTGFTIEVDGRQYVVTAKHLLPGTNQLADIEIYRDHSWRRLSVTVLRSEDADVAVLVPPVVLTPALKVVFGKKGAFLSQEVFFLGFPWMMGTEVAADVNNGYPIPFIKKGTLSAWYKGQAKYDLIFVDGINNPGFSGGPLVGVNIQTKDTMVMGVVTGYRTNPDTVMNNDLDTGLKSLGNSGIIVCYDIQYALDEIKKQPNGPKVPSQ
jgi:hypothetical protein